MVSLQCVRLFLIQNYTQFKHAYVILLAMLEQFIQMIANVREIMSLSTKDSLGFRGYNNFFVYPINSCQHDII